MSSKRYRLHVVIALLLSIGWIANETLVTQSIAQTSDGIIGEDQMSISSVDSLEIESMVIT